jgi:hypothetical protein
MNPGTGWARPALAADQAMSPAEVDVIGHQLGSRDAPESAQAA